MKMIDVGFKERTERVATATARIQAGKQTVRAIRRGAIVKGDVVAAARLAGIMGAKKTPDLVPLCHPISLAGVEVEVELEASHIILRATVKTVDRTGVEMEALTAVTAAALTVYDMCKSIDPSMVIERVQLEHKRGGKSGAWSRRSKKERS